MPGHIIIDGNNLLYAMHEHAPLPPVGRETLVKIIERWARNGKDQVTLVFDGPVPRDGLSRQMSSRRIDVRFSAPATADDVIARMIHRARDPGSIQVVSSDTALRHEAGLRRCRPVDSVAFVRMLFEAPTPGTTPSKGETEKPKSVSPGEVDEWMSTFGFNDDNPTDDRGSPNPRVDSD